MPNSLACPAIKALPNGIPFAETFRKITPLGTGFGNPEYAINEQAIIFGCHPRIALLAGQKVLDTFPMFIRDSVARQHGGPSLVRENRVRSLPQLPNYCPHGRCHDTCEGYFLSLFELIGAKREMFEK